MNRDIPTRGNRMFVQGTDGFSCHRLHNIHDIHNIIMIQLQTSLFPRERLIYHFI